MVVTRFALVVAVLLVVSTEALAGPSDTAAAQSLARLKEGNARFVADPAGSLPISAGRREALARGQDPFAIVLSCADSRVPPEVVFHTGLGDLFVVRSAGEVLDRSILASLEYGAEHLKTPLLVVMGHEFCGAVKAAAETAPGAKSMGPNLDFLIKSIQPAVARTQKTLFEEPLKAAVLANVEQIVANLQTESEILRERVEAGELMIVGAYYQLSTGQVTFSQPASGAHTGVKPASPSAPSAAASAAGSASSGATPRSGRAGRPVIEIHELQPKQPPQTKETPKQAAVPAESTPAGHAPAAAAKPKAH
jgi:carbonic anhydrase